MTSTYADKVLSAPFTDHLKRQEEEADRFWKDLDLQREKAKRKQLRKVQAEAVAAHKKALIFQRQQQRAIERANRDAAFVYEQTQRDARREKYRLKHKQLSKISSEVRNRILAALKYQETKKSGPTLNLLGCSIATFKRYTEKRFKPGMSWDNYGGVWCIGYIRSCAKFNLLKRGQQRKCFSYRNTRPLFVR